MDLSLGLSPGDQIEIIWGKKRKRVQRAVVLGEYSRFIRVDIGCYPTTISKADICTGKLTIQKTGGT